MFGSTEIPDLIDDNNFTYKKRNYLISDITALRYRRESVKSSIYFIPVNTSDDLEFTIEFSNNEKLNIKESIKGENKVLLEFFDYIRENSFQNRILKYVTTLEKDKCFTYNNIFFHENGDIVQNNKKFNIKENGVRFGYEPFTLTVVPKQGFFEGIFNNKKIQVEINNDMDCFMVLMNKLYSIDWSTLRQL